MIIKRNLTPEGLKTLKEQSFKQKAELRKMRDPVQERIDSLVERLKEEQLLSLGYPCTKFFDYSPLYSLLGFSVNNVGDPFVKTNSMEHTHDFEREVIAFFQDMLLADKNETWGYVTNGGTEGNLYGLYLAREKHPDGIVYYSDHTHYSVVKNLKILGMKAQEVATLPNGEIDYIKLRAYVMYNNKPAIILANLGTTMTGAIDDISKIQVAVGDTPHYIHADGALGGMILPFVDHPTGYSFKDGINSISISGHKLIGSPIPCGVVIAEKDNVDRIGNSIEYIRNMDNTITGSRNGISPMFLWYAIQLNGFDGFKQIVNDCIDLADYAIDELQKIGVDAWRNENSITVVFPLGADWVMSKYHIAPENGIGHLITMPKVSKKQVDDFVKDFKNSLQE